MLVHLNGIDSNGSMWVSVSETKIVLGLGCCGVRRREERN